MSLQAVSVTPMNLVAVDIESIRIGLPLPFSLRGEGGILLANKGFVVASRDDLEWIRGRGLNFYVDVDESDNLMRAFVGKMYELINDEIPLGKIADVRLSSGDFDLGKQETDDRPDWLNLQQQCRSLLRDFSPVNSSGAPVYFSDRIDHLQATLSRHARRNPDGTLFALIHLSATEVRMYSATHAMLVSVMCGLAAREVLNWPRELEDRLCKAALTMNIGMTDLQDRLAGQAESPNATQRQMIEEHPVRSHHMLRQLGINDEAWLEAVRDHHTKMPGPLEPRPEGQRMARLIQRADMFAARLAPRASRVPISPAAAMQAAYFDENRKIDEAGAALIKAVGMYQPGSYVRLATNEVGVVVRRSASISTPYVAVVINRDGMPTGEPVIRQTSFRENRVLTSVAHREVKVQIILERFLPLTETNPSRRFN